MTNLHDVKDKGVFSAQNTGRLFMEGEKVCQYTGKACFPVGKISYVEGIPRAFREHDGHRYQWPDFKRDRALMVC